ncbi:interferon-induced protein 44-like isoform X1 [Xiphophorus hellerii]|uniref:interferon-induced protein 44-like isoform X1 n=1 Tax=Xiphophorus hellerii TaxID=8084 RepID=UPI0013B389E9|nr:interferon-induced protein 44-like isoform X1 [Xiphophorus hellerii]
MTEKRLSFNGMGRINSKTLPPLLEKPWLQIDWEDRETDLQFINDYKPKGGHRQFRILLHGPVGAGKSSFINSVFSVLEGKICHKATACNIIQTSFTKKYMTYKLKKGDQKNVYPFVLNDMTGLSNISWKHRRVYEKDMKMAMKGHIRDEYKFHPQSALSETDPFFNRNPTVNDKAHILVTVFDANTINQLDESVAETIQEIRDEATELGIPHVADLTKTDDVCSETRSDETNVRRSQEKVQSLRKTVKIPDSCDHPVKTYESRNTLSYLSDVRSQAEPDEDFASCQKRCWVLRERKGSSLNRTQLHWEQPSKDWEGNLVRQQQVSDVMTDGNLPEPQTDSGVNMKINLILRRSADHSD